MRQALGRLFFWLVMGPVMGVLTLLRPLVLVRAQSMLTYRIGHFSMNNEMYLCEKEAGKQPPRTFDIFFHTPKVCNEALKRIIDRGPQRISRLGVYIAKAVERSGRFKDHLVHTSSRDRLGIFEGTKPHFSLSEAELAEGRAFLAEHGIDENRFVCLLCRDSAYLEQHLPEADWSYHDYRDVDVNTYLPALEALAERGYTVLRMGAAVKQPLASKNPRIIDYAGSGLRTELLDVFLSARCSFFISNGSGLDGVAKMFRRPILYVNLVPLCYVRSETARDVILPKRLVREADGRALTIGELMRSGAGSYTRTDHYREAGLRVADNTPEELAEACLEMADRFEGNWTETDEDRERMARFWSHFTPDGYNQVFLSKIARTFLTRHERLLGDPEQGDPETDERSAA